MSQPRSVLLTIFPNGKWYLHDQRLISRFGTGKKLKASVGSLSKRKTVILGLPQIQPGRIRTKVRLKMWNGHLRIGPLMGILTVGEGSSFYGNRENFRDIIQYGSKLGALVYVFTPNGIDWEEKQVRGFLYDEKQRLWIEATLPFPQVVYNRIPSRKWEQKPEVNKTLEQIAKLQHVTLFNLRFFNKLQLFQILVKAPHVAKFLPETKSLDSYENFEAFCSRHASVYLKPVLGKAGEGIMRLDRFQKRWRLRQVHQQESVTRYFFNLRTVWRYIKQQIRSKQYLIQEGITLAKYRGRPFDIRVLVQKNGAGEWGVTGVGIRRAGARSITTHVPRGGSMQSTTKVLRTLFGSEKEQLLRQIHQTALEIANALNEQIPSLAEMSMDLGLTRDGQLWFFEANAKPEKFDEPAIRRSSLSNLIHYAQHVSRMAPVELQEETG
ncbi:YheC/YheD family protein [Brevibacillus fulvus]|uniref:ATP-grasp domain-containing protein n=1 Tax=Brevibacillus fulvus TaxID=1125967 RepID=A0A938Y478_9BACL|nr:YheC/YheD family protein [Brevibacillus fulvus]MBM7591297.1 hypothetical protein [Brevibacillus fulvus]